MIADSKVNEVETCTTMSEVYVPSLSLMVITLVVVVPSTASVEVVVVRATSIVSASSLFVSSLMVTSHVAVCSLAGNVTILVSSSGRSTKSSTIVAAVPVVPAKLVLID